jgi:polysaccharide pyruvyl transferase WcaK-like protein
METHFLIEPKHWLSAHQYLAQQSGPVDALIEKSLSAGREKVIWLYPVSSTSVYYIEGLYRIAEAHGFTFKIETNGDLNDRELAFLQDFQRHCLKVSDEAPTEALGIRDYVAAAKEVLDAIFRGLLPRAAITQETRSYKKVVVIGAYGGDHVGDAGILGGVLLTLNKTFGTTHATVMSHRPEHTRRLASGLVTPVEVDVRYYDAATTDKALADASALVLAGGPLMDLPRVLLKHLSAAYRARSLGLPFIIERVGIGPFKREVSKQLATKLIEEAREISVRSTGAAKDPVLKGRMVRTGLDPAFDYLASRTELSRVNTHSIAEVDALLENRKGRPLIGVNLRPIRHSWASAGADYAKQAEDRFTQHLADALAAASDLAPQKPIFVFFPMNPIQFGMSDLLAAVRLQKALNGRAEMRVWQADPEVDDVLMFLRKMDAVVAMRLHACIFTASQNKPLFGIDYYPGDGGKVEQLFSDLGKPEHARRIDTFEPQWLTQHLLSVINSYNQSREIA